MSKFEKLMNARSKYTTIQRLILGKWWVRDHSLIWRYYSRLINRQLGI